MFTGIIQAIGKVREPEKLGNGVRLTITTPEEFHLEEVHVGDSIAVNGACMTVTKINGRDFQIDVSAESLSKTTGLDTFGEVNLEKAMRLGDRVDGHLVSGHVDGVGSVESFEKVAESYKLVIRAPLKLSPYLAYKGSVAVNGVSLTVCSPTDDTFTVAIIPYTFEHTNFSDIGIGSTVNVEFDILGKYIARLSHFN